MGTSYIYSNITCVTNNITCVSTLLCGAINIKNEFQCDTLLFGAVNLLNVLQLLVVYL